MTLSLIVPCYNEEKNVEPLLNACQQAFSDLPGGFEMIFVNDGSRDNTWGVLTDLFDRYKDVVSLKLLNFSRNFGKEAAMFAGLKHASGTYTAMLDADLQQDPALVAQMVDFLEKNPAYDVVAAYQEERIEGRMMSWYKKIFYKLVNRVCEVEFYAGASDFRTMRRSVVDAILQMPEYHRFSKGIFSWVGFETYYMPYIANKRNAGKSAWTFKKLLKYAFEGFLSFTTFPLKIASILGILSSLGSLIYLLVVVIQKLCFGIEVPGYATVVALILLLGGLQLVILGVIGEYLARVYIEGKHRPIYLLKGYIGNDTEDKTP